MSALEKNFVKRIMKQLRKDGCHAQRHEDKYSSGIPDIEFCKNGGVVWLEAKVIRIMPVRSTTKIRFDWRDDQRLWAEDRIAAGGRAYGILQVSRTECLLLWHDCPELPLDELRSNALDRGSLAQILANLYI